MRFVAANAGSRCGAGSRTDAKGRPEWPRPARERSRRAAAGGGGAQSGSTPASASPGDRARIRQPRKKARNSRKSGASRSGRSRVSADSGKRSSVNSSSGSPAVKQIASKRKDAVTEGMHSGAEAISSTADTVKWPAVAGGAALAEIRKTRVAIENGTKHSSPIEVVLSALTARR